MRHCIHGQRTPTRRRVLQGLAGTAGLLAMPRSGWAQAKGAPIKIGVCGPFTAQFAQLGQWMKNGINVAVRETNERGGVKGQSIEVVFADDQGPNPTVAANAVTKLLAQEKVVALIGPHFTPAILPNLPLLDQFQIPSLTGASGPAVTDKGSKWVFRIRLNDSVGAGLLVAFVSKTLGWKKIGLEYVNTAFGQSGINAVKLAMAAAGMEPAVIQTHNDGTRDFTPHILALNEAAVDGVIVWTDDQPAGLFAKQTRTMGAKFAIAGSTAFSGPLFLQLAGDAAEGIYSITDFTKSNPKPAIQAWNKRYEDIFHEKPELYATTYYDAVNLTVLALSKSASLGGSDIRTALTELRQVDGVMTTYDWSANGDMVHSGLITQIQGGSPKVVKTLEG